MKKILASMALLISGSLSALPTGNPADPILFERIDDEGCLAYSAFDLFNIRIGYYGDFIFDRKMESEKGERVQSFELNTNGGLIALNVLNHLDIYGILGGSNIILKNPANIFFPDADPNIVTVESETDFSWTYGARVTLLDCNNLIIGIDARHFFTRPSVNQFFFVTEDNPLPPLPMRFDEWQVSLGAAYQVSWFIPYISAKYSHAKFSITGIDVPFRNRQRWGYTVGMSLIRDSLVTINVEGRFRDEKAISVNAQILF